MSNDYYNPTGNPQAGSFGASNAIKSEFVAVQTGFDKLPVISGNTDKIVAIGPGSMVPKTPGELGLSTVTALNAEAAARTAADGAEVTARNAAITAAVAVETANRTSAIAAVIPAGTRIIFAQAAPPAGFTLVTTETDRMLRLVNSTGGGIGGSHSPILMNVVPSHTHANTISDPGHFHDQHQGQIGAGVTGVGGRYADGADAGESTLNTSTKTTGITITNVANAGASDWTPKYINVIIGQKT